MVCGRVDDRDTVSFQRQKKSRSTFSRSSAASPAFSHAHNTFAVRDSCYRAAPNVHHRAPDCTTRNRMRPLHCARTLRIKMRLFLRPVATHIGTSIHMFNSEQTKQPPL